MTTHATPLEARSLPALLSYPRDPIVLLRVIGQKWWQDPLHIQKLTNTHGGNSSEPLEAH